MAEYIEREKVINDIGELFTLCSETLPNECGHHFIVEKELETHLDFVRKLPAADVVPLDVYKQTAWERDTAIEQLRQIGKALGEKMDDIVRVKRGRWKFHKDGSGTCSVCGFHQCDIWDLDDWQNYCGVCGADMREVVPSV